MGGACGRKSTFTTAPSAGPGGLRLGADTDGRCFGRARKIYEGDADTHGQSDRRPTDRSFDGNLVVAECCAQPVPRKGAFMSPRYY